MIPLYKPYMPELPELDAIIHSGRLAYGKYSMRFEAFLKEYFNTKQIIVTNSFNSAISVVISTLGLKYNDEIIASPMACLASIQPYVSSGLKVVWADIDNNRGTLDPDSVRSKITSNTKCIVHNHFCGYPGYVDEINAIAEEFGITVIDDGIEAFGSEYKDKKIGNCGSDITIFSFTPVRIPNTIDGGAIIFKNEQLYQKSLLVRDCGIDRRKFRDSLEEISSDCDINLIGYSAMMSDVNGYIGCQQMLTAENLITRQRKQASKWAHILDDVEYSCLNMKDTYPNFWVFGILARDKQQAIMDFRDKGYYASGVHINNNIYSIFGKYYYLPGVEDFHKKFLALPCGWWLE